MEMGEGIHVLYEAYLLFPFCSVALMMVAWRSYAHCSVFFPNRVILFDFLGLE